MIPGSRVWIAAPTMDLGKKEFRVVWDLTVTKGHIPVRRKSEREKWIEFENGSEIFVRSEDAGENQFVGEGVDLLIIAEAARLKIRSWTEFLRPTLADRQGKALFSSTPRGYNWFRDFWLRGQPEGRVVTPKWRSWKIPSSANPLVDAEEIEDARNSLPRALFEQEWLAEFTNFSGKVFDEFSEKIHVRRFPYEHHLPTRLWIDPGYTNPYSVLLVQVTPDEQVRVLDEVYVQGKVTDKVIDIVERKWPFAVLDGNHARADLRVVVDEAAAEPMAAWRLKGYNAVGGKPGVAQGIEVIHRLLRDPFRSIEPDEDNPDGIVPRMTFDPKCRYTLDEFQLYHYPDKPRQGDVNNTELPADKDNHSIAALRYGLYDEFPALFNERSMTAEEEHLLVSADDFGPSVRRMRMEDSYSDRTDLRLPFEDEPFGGLGGLRMPVDRQWSLGGD